MKWSSIFFVLILLLGIAIRMYNISGQQLWSDEIDTLYRSQNVWHFYPIYLFYQSEKYHDNNDSIFDVTTHAGFANQQPLYYTLLALWTSTFGFSVIAARLFSALLGVLSLVVLFFLAKELFGRRTALLASFLFAISPFHLYYAHELRSYVLVTLLALTSSLFFWRLLKKKNGILPYGIFIGLLLLAHTHAWFFVFSQWIFVFLFARASFPSFLKAQGIAFLVYLPWLPHFINQLLFIDTSSTVYFDFNFLDLPAVYLVFGLGQTLIVKESPWFFLITIGVLYLLSFAFPVLYALWKEQKSTIAYVLLWLILPVFLPWLISIMKPLYTYRYVSVSSAALLLLVGHGYACLAKRHYSLFVVLFLTATLLSLGSVVMYNTFPARMQSSDVADYLAFSVAPQEKIYVHHGNYNLLLKYYRPELPSYGLAQRASEILPLADIQEFIARVAQEKSFWFVYASAKNKEDIHEEILHVGFHVAASKKFTGFYVYKYEKKTI